MQSRTQTKKNDAADSLLRDLDSAYLPDSDMHQAVYHALRTKLSLADLERLALVVSTRRRPPSEALARLRAADKSELSAEEKAGWYAAQLLVERAEEGRS